MELKARRKRRKLLYFRIASAVMPAAWLGSVLGFGVLALIGAWPDLTISDIWRMPLFVIVMATMFGLPVTVLGLLAIGLPLAYLLRGYSHRKWMALLALALGAGIGLAGFHMLNALFLFGSDSVWAARIDSLGLLMGGFTGLLWYGFARNLFTPIED